MERGVEEQIEDLKRQQDAINKGFEEDIKALKLGQKTTHGVIDVMDRRVQTLSEEVSGNVKNLVSSNNTVRMELTKFTDYFLDERRESERREHEAKERDAQAKRDAEKRSAQAKKDAEERADRMRVENRNNIFKLLGMVLGSGGVIYGIVMALLP